MKQMKAITAPKVESNTLTIPSRMPRLARPVQRPATFRSGKEYRRKEGKRID